MDKSSFEKLYIEQLPGLYRLAMSILHHQADAQDAVQQSVLKAWKRVENIRNGKEKAYLAWNANGRTSHASGSDHRDSGRGFHCQRQRMGGGIPAQILGNADAEGEKTVL